MTHDEALRTVAADMHAALQAWQDAYNAQQDCQQWLWPNDEDAYENAENKAHTATQTARMLTAQVNHRIQEICADSVTPVTLDIGEAE